MAPGVCTIKLFTAVIYGFSLEASVFVSGKPYLTFTWAPQWARVFFPFKPFQPGLMFAGKAGAYQSEAPLGWKGLP
jgi:hypothetical protein